MVDVTPEIARRELERRKGLNKPVSSSITPNMARQELERRRSLKPQESVESPQEESFGEYAKRGLARGARNAVVGALDTLDFLATPVRAGLNVGARKLGIPEVPMLGEKAAEGIDTLTGGYTASRTPDEKTTEAITRAIAGLPVGLGAGTALKALQHAPKIIGKAGQFLRGSSALTPTNIAGTAATSGLIQSSLNQSPEDVVGALGKGVVGGVAVPTAIGALGMLTKGGRQGAAARMGERLKINPQAVETFEQAGITPTLADVSTSKVAKMAQSAMEHAPFSSENITKARNLQREQILSQLGQGEYGNVISRGEAGRLATKGAKAYQKGKSKEFGSMFEKIEKDIERLPDDTIGIEHTNKYFDSFLKNIKTPSQQKRFEKSPVGKLYKDLYETAKKNKGRIPYHDAKERLDEINDLITTHGQIGKISQGKLKQFASNLSKDIESDLEPKFKSLGEDSYKNWKETKKYYAQYAQEEVPKLNELFKKDKKGATEAFGDILINQKKGAEKAKAALQGLNPHEQLELTDAIHKNLGRKTDGSFSPLKWSREFKALEPESQKILLSPLNEPNQNKLKFISETMDHLKSTLEEANTSKTAYYTALGALGSAGLGASSALIAGNPLPAMKLAGGLFASRFASEKLMTNPKFINWIYQGMKAKNLGQFERNLQRVPHIGSLRKSLVRSVQQFQKDIDSAGEKQKQDKK